MFVTEVTINMKRTMKPIMAMLLSIAIMFTFIPVSLATNADTQNGETEGGTDQNFYNPGWDAVRISIVDKTAALWVFVAQ